jgi:hypothetical protein
VLLTLLPDRRAQSLLVRRALLQEGRKDLPIAGFREHILINHASEDVAHELAPTDAAPGRLVIDGWEIVDAHAPGEDETVLRKLRYDAFYGTPLDHLLRLWTIDTPVICGTVADICVHYTAASAALRWYTHRHPARCDLGARSVRSGVLAAAGRLSLRRPRDDRGRPAYLTPSPCVGMAIPVLARFVRDASAESLAKARRRASSEDRRPWRQPSNH